MKNAASSQVPEGLGWFFPNLLMKVLQSFPSLNVTVLFIITFTP